MSYTATGQWKDDEEGEVDVEKRLTGLLSKDSDYIKQGQTQGLQYANKRGLLNSSIAAQAGEAARIDSALPIASQDAAQANSRVMQGRGLQSTDVLQGRQIASSEKMQGTDIASRERMQGTEIAANKDLQGTDIASREKMQGADIASRQQMQQSDQANQQWLAKFDAGTREKLQALDADTRTLMQSLDLQSQQRIANMNIATEERVEAARIAATFETSYAAQLANIMNNPDIPADVRQTYIDHANTIRESNLHLVEQLYGIDLQWQTGGP